MWCRSVCDSAGGGDCAQVTRRRLVTELRSQVQDGNSFRVGLVMSIYICEGLPGHGKTTFAFIMGLRWQAHYKRTRQAPRQIVSNVSMDIPGVQIIESFAELKQSERCIVIIDEANMWFSGHNARANQEHLDFFTQHRKEGNSLFLITQSWSSLDLTVRSRTCEGVYNVRRLFGPTIWEEPSWVEKRIGWWSVVRRYSSENYDTATKKKCYSTEFIRLDKWHGRFDTLAKVGRIDAGVNGRGAGLAVAHKVQELKPGDGIITAREYDLARLWAEYLKSKGRAHNDRTALAPEVGALSDARVIADFRQYCRGCKTDEFGMVRYERNVDDAIDDYLGARLRLSEGGDNAGSGLVGSRGLYTPDMGVSGGMGMDRNGRKGAA